VISYYGFFAVFINNVWLKINKKSGADIHIRHLLFKAKNGKIKLIS
jgi:hypothetical protein